MPLTADGSPKERRASVAGARRGSVAKGGSLSPKSPNSPNFEDSSPGRRSSAFPGSSGAPSKPPSSPAGSPRKRRASVKSPKGDDDEGGGASNVKVFLRVRPFNAREMDIQKEGRMLRSIIDMPGGANGQVHFLEKLKGETEADDEFATAEIFDFDRCMWSIYPDQQPYAHEFCQQMDVFDHMGAPALANAWKGFNTCIFAYGQTGAGKTHTMMGHFAVENGQLKGDPGVIPHLCEALYTAIDKKKSEAEEKKVITVTYETELCAYEIYNERVRDLFYMHTPGRKPKDELRVRKHPLEGPFVDGISTLRPKSWEECITDVEEGNSHRTTGETAMNAESSRSHSVFQIRFTQVETSIPQERYEKPVTNRKYSCINLIDLAGSERNKKSKAAGERLVEATNINLSLTTLKRVIDALVYNSNNRTNPKQVPYRDSVLTMLLSHSLGGNSKTTMVACVSPHYDNGEETLNTLRYASQARKIVNVVRVNEDTKAKQNLMLKEQLAQLQAELTERQAGGGTVDPAEIAALQDEINAGQDTLHMYEEEAKKMREEMEEEVEKRYQQAFQHSFQMVIMRKQKERAQQEAARAAKLQSEAERAERDKVESEERMALMQRDTSNLRKVHEKTKQEKERLEKEIAQTKEERESTLENARDIQRKEQEKRVQAEKNAEKQLSEAEQIHRAELEAVINQAAQQCSTLKKAIQDRDDEVEDYQERIAEVESASEKKLKDSNYHHKVELDEVRSKLQMEIRSLEREVADQRIAFEHNEEVLIRENEERKRMLEFTSQNEMRRVRDESERRTRTESADWEHKMAELERRSYEEVRELKVRHRTEFDDQRERLEGQLTEYLAKIHEQIGVLEDVKKKELRYRDLYRQIEHALDRKRTEDENASADLREFLELCRQYCTQLSSFPINRAKVERAALPVSAFVSQAPPTVGNYDEASYYDNSPSPNANNNTSRSPSRRRRSIGASTRGSPNRTGSPQWGVSPVRDASPK